jgi:hypothetical protein
MVVRNLAGEVGIEGATDSLLMLVEIMARCVLQHVKTLLKEKL